jgi:hypothetical protein
MQMGYGVVYTIGFTTLNPVRSGEDTFFGILLSVSTAKMHFVGCSDD